MDRINYSEIAKLNPFRRLLFGQPGRSENLFKLDGGTFAHLAGAAAVPISELAALAAQTLGCQYRHIETTFYTGIYLEFPDAWSLIIQPRYDNIDLGVVQFNQSMESQLTEELLTFGIANKIPSFNQLHFGILWALVEIYAQALSSILKISTEQFHHIKLINTYTRIRQLYGALDAGQVTGQHSYIEDFSWYYFLEIQSIAKYFKADELVYLHDVATNSANFPNLVQQLVKEGKLPFCLDALSCSDYQPSVAVNNVNIIDAAFSHKSNIRIDRVDLKNKNPVLLSANVITANDVLEHFDEEESKFIFKNLWAHTKKLLIIHVPIELVPARHYGHLTTFTQKKLNDWALTLPKCRNLTHNYLEDYKIKYGRDIDGFLILEKY